MIALRFDGRVELCRDAAEPRAGPDEALLAVRVAGICRTDLEIAKGYMGFSGVMGHEFVGTVLDGPEPWRGKRVVAEINCACTECDACKSALANHCPRRTVLGIDGRDGVFAERVAVPVRNLHEVPEAISDEQAVFVEPLAAAFQIIRQVPPAPGHSAVVLGDGRLGQLAARVLTGRVGKLLLVGRHAAKLAVAGRAGIATAAAADFAPDGTADVVVDATGSVSGFELAMRTVRPRGTIVLKSTFAAESGMNLAPLVIDEITVVGSRCGPFEDAIRALSGGEIDLSGLVSRRFALADAVAALDAARCPSNIKVLIDVATR